MKNNDTRERIIQVASLMFFENGYDNCTLRAIAKECGISHAAIYKYFGNKYELASITIKRYLNELVRKTREFGENEDITSNKDIIAFYWYSHQHFMLTHPNFFRFYTEFYVKDIEQWENVHMSYRDTILHDVFLMKHFPSLPEYKYDLYARLLSAGSIELLYMLKKGKLDLDTAAKLLIEMFGKLSCEEDVLTEKDFEHFKSLYEKGTDNQLDIKNII